MFIKVSYTFLDSNSICHKCFCPGPHGGGGGGEILGAIFTSFSICQDDILRAFSPTRTALWWNTGET